MGGKSATTTQQVQIPPEVMARYRAVNTRAEQAATQPFQAYSQDPSAFVAPLTQTQQAGIIEKELPIDASNVMLLSKGKPTRVGFKVNADGTKVRVAKKTGEEV